MSKFESAVPVLLHATAGAPLFAYMAKTGRALPMAIGISGSILASALDPAERLAIKRAFAQLANSKRYLEAMAADGAVRYGIDCGPTGPVSDADKAHAQAVRDRFHDRRSAPVMAPSGRVVLKLRA